VPLAPLFARSVYKAMMGQQGWDEVYPNQEALRADLQCFKDALVESAEGNWWKREAMLLVAGDASEFAYAAYTPEGELGAPIVVSFSAEELQLMEDNEFSSTLREILCMLKTAQVILQQDAFLIEHKCNVWDANMGSVISLTTTAVPFCYNWFRILKLVALILPVSAPDLRNSWVASSILTFRCAVKEYFSQSNILQLS